MINEVAQLEAKLLEYAKLADINEENRSSLISENEKLREYATHVPGCYESGNECICGLDELLARKDSQ